MCAVCGYTADDFWASFAIDQNGPFSPAAIRPSRARSLCNWVQLATRAMVASRDQDESALKATAPLVIDIRVHNEQSSGLFSGAYIKASNRGYTVNSSTGAMRFCSSLHALVSHIKNQRPDLCHVLVCHWPSDHRKVDWAVWGAAWTWNAVMNGRPEPLPERVELIDGRWVYFEPLENNKVKVWLDTIEAAV